MAMLAMSGGREGVVGRRGEGVLDIEVWRRRCLAVAVRTARGGGLERVEEVVDGGWRIGVRKVGVGAGRDWEVSEAVS